MDKAVVLLSGGMDSATLLHMVVEQRGVPEVHALSFRYGQKHERELEMARRQADLAEVRAHRVIDLSALKDLVAGGSALTDDGMPVPKLSDLDEDERSQPPTYVPNRNMILLALAAAYAEAQGIADVFYGAQAQDEYGYWDCTDDYLQRLNQVLDLNRRTPVRIHAPLMRMSKGDGLAIGLSLGVNFACTWSCYRGEERACGRCPTCVERLAAFRDVGVDDPVEYDPH